MMGHELEWIRPFIDLLTVFKKNKQERIPFVVAYTPTGEDTHRADLEAQAKGLDPNSFSAVYDLSAPLKPELAEQMKQEAQDKYGATIYDGKVNLVYIT